MVVIFLSFSACPQKIDFLKSSVIPAAEGYVKIKTDNNNNNVIKIKLRNLAEIERLQPPRKSYVIWMTTEQDMTKKIGRISSSSHLNATFETVSSYKPTKIFITAEVDEDAEFPGETIVLTTENFGN